MKYNLAYLRYESAFSITAFISGRKYENISPASHKRIISLWQETLKFKTVNGVACVLLRLKG